MLQNFDTSHGIRSNESCLKHLQVIYFIFAVDSHLQLFCKLFSADINYFNLFENKNKLSICLINF